MADHEQYAPGPANGAQIKKDGEKWTLILVRELRHSPEKVWQALTEPALLREWAPLESTLRQANHPDRIECRFITPSTSRSEAKILFS